TSASSRRARSGRARSRTAPRCRSPRFRSICARCGRPIWWWSGARAATCTTARSRAGWRRWSTGSASTARSGASASPTWKRRCRRSIMTAADKRATRDIVVEGVLPHAPEIVWKALTSAELVARWLLPNDFAAEVGRRFTFRTRPMGDWDGVVRCEVLEVVSQRKLVYSWKGGARTNTKYGASLDTVVTW